MSEEGKSCCSVQVAAPNSISHGPWRALEAPFAMGDASGLVQTKQSPENLLLLSSLLRASDFDVEAAQRGVVYLDRVDQTEAQKALLQVWQGHISEPLGPLPFDRRERRFVCGGTFPAPA